MPRSGCSDLHGVNPNSKKLSYRCIVNIWWNINVQMVHSNHSKEECIFVIKWLSLNFFCF